MSASPTDVVDRLERLAAQAPVSAVDPDALWAHGRRRQRVRTGAAAAAIVVVGLLGTATTPVLVERAQPVGPSSTDRMVLPDVVREPGGWEPAFPAAPGRLSAVGFGQRSGLWSSRPAWWGVSATTGESRFLDLPGDAQAPDTPALSADGTRLAYWVTGEVSGEPLTMSGPSDSDVEPVVGVAVLDLRTGEREAWTLASEHGLGTSGLAWSGDVLVWSAGAVRREGATAVSAAARTRTWDLSTGEQHVSRSWITPQPIGDAPSGFVVQYQSDRATVVTDGAAAPALRLALPSGETAPTGAGSASVSTDGARLAALLVSGPDRSDGTPQPLAVGEIDGRDVALEQVGEPAAQDVLGWRSPTEVVLSSLATVEEGRPRRALRAWTVDVTTGERTELLEFSGDTPRFAAEAWAAEIVDAPDAPFAPDPRLVGLALLVGSLVVWQVARRVRTRRDDA